jgi:tRNA (guanine6-N2)-methyltransferase
MVDRGRQKAAYPDGSVDHITTNPPWDRQVAARGAVPEFLPTGKYGK